MKHIEDMRVLVHTLLRSRRFHCLIIEGPPGWGKSTTVGKVLGELGITFESVGAYITPLELFKSLRGTPTGLHVLDDSEGVLGSPAAVSILRSAIWCGASSATERCISWTSPASGPSNKFVFSGKVILLTNSTSGITAKMGLLSRSLHFRIRLPKLAKAQVLADVAGNSDRFPDQVASASVTEFLVEQMEQGVRGINLRTLELGYELIQADSTNWISVMKQLLPGPSPKQILRQLRESDMSVEEQAKSFSDATGLSRRTFFNQRKKWVLSEFG